MIELLEELDTCGEDCLQEVILSADQDVETIYQGGSDLWQ